MLLVLINCDLCAIPSIGTRLGRVMGLENSNIPALFRPLSYFLSSFTVSKIGQYQLHPSKILTSSGFHFKLCFANSVRNGELQLKFPEIQETTNNVSWLFIFIAKTLLRAAMKAKSPNLLAISSL